ncbi:hypothetical protein ORI20_10310 [Mycobacterium sp. CVI_P3]|uniref:Uncharacterized protein n=1 Tax=Mycobacterium pinniadriaticum TaxID=2994102 RepID=A0ABT3SC57_9MYCO|nr:hypothetical protein [Mycobacterium pinniadriaticum]MCX2930671.1 hypothetical protein [Mycobacterium pinniadriaticum]MCX2937095.1 hypothetical protein [Mycobacterium pinniadriaticum]
MRINSERSRRELAYRPMARFLIGGVAFAAARFVARVGLAARRFWTLCAAVAAVDFLAPGRERSRSRVGRSETMR